jgi:plasmid stability protein
MDTTIRNLDEDAFRRLKARAALEGRPIGVVLSDLMREASGTGAAWPKKGSAHDIRPEPFGKRNRHLSEEIDAIVYGT